MVWVIRDSDIRKDNEKLGQFVFQLMLETILNESGLYVHHEDFSEGRYCSVYTQKDLLNIFKRILEISERKNLIEVRKLRGQDLAVYVRDSKYEPLAINFGKKYEEKKKNLVHIFVED
jgi:hypothetical protein